AGLACAGLHTQGMTDHWGLDVNVAPSSIYYTEITLTATSAAGEQSWVLFTDDLYARSDSGTTGSFCEAESTAVIVQWTIDERYDIGRLGEHLPFPRRLQFAVTPGGLGEAGVHWQLADPHSASISVDGGSASPL